MAFWRFAGACVISAAALVAACDEEDSGSDASTGGRAATGGQSATGLTPCLDRQSALQRPPKGSLPCDLIPPDFGK